MNIFFILLLILFLFFSDGCGQSTKNPVTAEQITQNYLITLKNRALLIGLNNLWRWAHQNKVHTKEINPNIILKSSISSDGNYVFTTSLNHDAILWDIQRKKYRYISHHAIVYSAYFIPHSSYFMWQQDKTYEIFIENIDGKIIKTFHSPQITYQMMTHDLKHYFGVDCGYKLYSISGSIIKNENDIENFCLGTGKLMNILLSPDQKYFLTSGFSTDNDSLPLNAEQQATRVSTLDGVVLWRVLDEKPIRKYPGTNMGTVAALSPDGNYLITGDEYNNNFLWDLKNGKQIFQFGQNDVIDMEKYTGNNDLLKKLPLHPTFTLQFIDESHFLKFITGSHRVWLYRVGGPKPIKYLSILSDVIPDNPLRNQSIDANAQKHILIIPHRNSFGIEVYRYQPKQQILKLWWSSNKKV